MELKPIGKVRSLSAGRSVLEVDDAYKNALYGIHPGDRVQVLYWMHELLADARQTLKVHPRGDGSRPLRGVFALRSPMRPNPIGVSVVKVVQVGDGQVTVTGLDALDGSPLVDIKGTTRQAPARLTTMWGKIHNILVGKLEDELGEEHLRNALYQALWEAGGAAAEGHLDDAAAIGRQIMTIEESFDIKGRICEDTPHCFVREVTYCPWSYFRPLSCMLFAWWMEGFCYGLNPGFRYRLEKLVPRGDNSCVWSVSRLPD